MLSLSNHDVSIFWTVSPKDSIAFMQHISELHSASQIMTDYVFVVLKITPTVSKPIVTTTTRALTALRQYAISACFRIYKCCRQAVNDKCL